MLDREKVIKEFELFIKGFHPACTSEGVELDMFREVLALLKEQDAKNPVVREKNGYWDYVCPTCGSRDEEFFREWNYCPFCGQEVKWE